MSPTVLRSRTLSGMPAAGASLPHVSRHGQSEFVYPANVASKAVLALRDWLQRKYNPSCLASA
jgi:hypothetical protein